MYHLGIKNIYRLKNLLRGVKTVYSLAAVEDLLRKTEALHKNSPELALKFARSWFYLPSLDFGVDPLSEAYFNKQKKTYEALAGKPWGTFDLVAQDNLAEFNNLGELYPYVTRDNHLVGAHLQKTGYWMSQMNLNVSDKIIEFGAGSGDLATFLSQSGYNILATDISQTYTDVIRRKAEFLKLPMKSTRADMSKFQAKELYDVAIFCEAFHHSSDFLALLEQLKRILTPVGKVYLCGEPITHFPYPWGVRTDGESIWMARRFGWLELGFDKFYFRRLVRSLGWSVSWSYNKAIDHAASVVCLKRNNFEDQS